MYAQCWNDGWQFWEDKNAFALVWSVSKRARTLTLPHDAMLERIPRPDSPNGGNTGWRDGGSYVYVKTLYAPEEYRRRTVALRFDGVYSHALVYVNGQLAANRPCGYVPFDVPLNDHLRCGEDNEIRVLVKNDGANSRWYSGSGIYRDVWLLTGDLVHLTPDSLRCETRWVDGESAGVYVEAGLRSRDAAPRALTVEFTLTDPEGTVCARGEAPITLFSGARETLGQSLLLPNPRLWSAQSPTLYTCTVRLLEDGVELDAAAARVGVRTLQLDPQHGLRVNGETVKLRGACIHHDNGPLGAVSLPEAELRRVRRMKEAGFNALRMAHNPASPALLAACDRLGMYVMEEFLDMWTRPKNHSDYALDLPRTWREDLSAMVCRDRVHPSVIFYSLGNEIPEVGLPHGTALGREMARLVKALDGERFVLTGINGVFASGDRIGEIVADVLAAAPKNAAEGNVNDFMSVMDTHMDEIVCHPIVSDRLAAAGAGLDLLGYNYMTARYEADSAAYPQRVMVGSETYPPEIARNWPLVQKLGALVGDFTWTGWDYIGEAGVGVPAYAPGEGGFGAQYPCQLAFCGDLDITGHRRPLSYLRELVFGLSQQPYVAVQDPRHYGRTPIKTPWVLSDAHPCWTWPGMEGKPVVVEVYAPGHRVELLRDGVSLGSAPAGEAAGFVARFETTYQPGVLEAVAYDEAGRELGRRTLASTGEPAALRLEAEPREEGELMYLSIALTDGAGQVVCHRDEDWQVSVAGGTLAGLASGDPKPTHNYLEPVVRAFHGRALAVVRPAGGPVTVTVTGAESGLTATLTLPG